jgi:hypothetical protein
MLVLFFFIRLASFVRVLDESVMGEQVKTMMRWRWDLFCRCLSASYARMSVSVLVDCSAGVRTEAIMMPV